MKEKVIDPVVSFHDTDSTSAEPAIHLGHEGASRAPETNYPRSDLTTPLHTPPALVPSPDGRRIEVSRALLLSLFAVGPRPRWHPVDDPQAVHQIAATFQTTLLYRGSRLDQDAATVLFGLIRREIGQEIGRKFPLPLRPFAKASAWSDSSSSNRRCLRALRVLAEGRARYTWNGEDEVEIGFLRIHEETATHAVVSFDPTFAWAFTGRRTFLDFERRTLLQSGLETWLYGLAMSNPCCNAFAMHRLHYLSGSTKLLRQFGADAVEAIATLVRCGLVRDCYLDRCRIRTARPDLFSSGGKGSGATRSSPVPRDPVTYVKIVKANSSPGDARPLKRAVSKTERPSAASKEPEQPEFGFDHVPYSSDEYDDSQPDLDDLPCGDNDE